MTSRPTVAQEAKHPHVVAFLRWRAGVRRNPGLAPLYKGGVFLLGLSLIALGLVLAVLPGPLTIPPVLAGLWVWSTEFSWAHRIFDNFKDKAAHAWEKARTKPVFSALVTGTGLLGAVLAAWAVSHYSLIDQARIVVGL